MVARQSRRRRTDFATAFRSDLPSSLSSSEFVRPGAGAADDCALFPCACLRGYLTLGVSRWPEIWNMQNLFLHLLAFCCPSFPAFITCSPTHSCSFYRYLVTHSQVGMNAIRGDTFLPSIISQIKSIDRPRTSGDRNRCVASCNSCWPSCVATLTNAGCRDLGRSSQYPLLWF